MSEASGKPGSELAARGISRRQLLQQTIVGAGAAALVVGMTSAAQAKMPQKGAGYQDTPKDGQSRADCTLFKAPDSCLIVDGSISANGWCRFYQKKS